MLRLRLAVLLRVSAVCGALFCHIATADVPELYQPNYDQGYEKGYSFGYKSGFDDGKMRGTNEGKENGRTDGFNTGWNETYQPAFDRAYDVTFPIGHAKGWEAGIVEGFQEGFDWAPVIASQFANSNSSWSGYSGSISGVMVYGNWNWGSTLDSADYSVWRDHIVEIDWEKHYYDQGYTDGNGVGFSIGSDKGYQLAYPVAYAAAYTVGYKNGLHSGTEDGFRYGGQQGHDDGWSLGYDSAFDYGFYAGLDYHLFGEYYLPEYHLEYSRRSTSTAPIPEPACLMLVGLASACGLLRRIRRS